MIIVTGGAGFIGSNIVRALNERGREDILIVDNLENGEKHLNLNRLRFADYIDKNDFLSFSEELMEDVEVVFHQGACSNTMETNGKYMMENNYDYTKTLFHLSQQRGFRLIYASSASVYGNGDNGFREAPECEYPLNVYAFSKYQADRYISPFLPECETQVVGLRYFNVYGPQENHKGSMASVIYHFFHQIMREGKIKPFAGSEKFVRDFIYVNDVVDVNMFFYDNPDKSGIFNCGTGNAKSFARIAHIMKELFEGTEIEEIPFPDKLKGKYQAYTCADLAKLRAAGYDKDFTTLEDGVRAYVNVLKATGGYLV